MNKYLLLYLILITSYSAYTQTNIKTFDSRSIEVLTGNYDPSDYNSNSADLSPEEMVAFIQNQINPDSLKQYLFDLSRYNTRNSGADTLSATTGMGAARTYIYEKFRQFDNRYPDRLIVDYLQFDQEICGMNRHKNVLAIRPGKDPNGGMIILEAHMDSRCADVCDVTCEAQGMEDNGSGTALIMELVRVFAQLELDRTLVLMTTTAEEQGLLGASAFVEYAERNNFDIKAVLNNDIVGGIYCGETSSQPSCPGLDHVDSTQVRLFSRGGNNSPFKALARYSKLQYEQMLSPIVKVPMLLTIMSQEDRGGRGGDHIPFREAGFTSIRYTSANEHGDAGIDDEYHDRQHTSTDRLGVDTDNDGAIDSFFVDFNYLARNSVINATTASMIAMSPDPISISLRQVGTNAEVTIDDPNNLGRYAIATRTISNDFDTVFLDVTENPFLVPIELFNDILRISAAGVNENGVESCFSEEELLITTSNKEVEIEERKVIELLQNRPNPFDEATIISFLAHENVAYEDATTMISTNTGKTIKSIPVEIIKGINEYTFVYGYGTSGTLIYSLLVDGQVVDSKQMIFAY